MDFRLPARSAHSRFGVRDEVVKIYETPLDQWQEPELDRGSVTTRDTHYTRAPDLFPVQLQGIYPFPIQGRQKIMVEGNLSGE